jgi:hypothetical protein
MIVVMATANRRIPGSLSQTEQRGVRGVGKTESSREQAPALSA